ncbi:MAG: two-component system sensor histidine kinase/response regulator [Cyclobacteriaceae bacterium]|jgi:two-component system sensor histidine kinase/response regulator
MYSITNKVTFRCLVCLIGLATQNHILAQSKSELDSVRQLLVELKDPAEKKELLLQLSDQQVYKQPDLALSYAQQALALEYSKSLTPEEIANIHLRIASAYWSKGNLAQALSELQQCLKEAESFNNPLLLSKIYMRIGSIFAGSGDNLNAVIYYQKAIPIFQDLEDSFIKFGIYNNIGKALMDMNKLDSAEGYFDQAYTIIDKIQTSYLPILLFNVAHLRYRQGEIDSSLEILYECDSLAQKYGDIRALIRVAQLQSIIHLEAGELHKSLPLIEFATEHAKQTNVKELITITQSSYSRILEKDNRIEEAFAALKLAELYEDSIQNSQAINKLELFSFNQSEKEKQGLIKQQEISQLKAKNQKLVAIASSFIAILTLAISIVFYLRQRLINRKNSDLRAKNLLIENQRKELDNLNSLKNKIMAITAHDIRGPLQSLYGIIDILHHKLLDPKELESQLPLISQQLAKVNLLLNNVFEWSRAGIVDDKVHKETVVVKTVIDSAINEQQMLADDKHLKVINKASAEYSAMLDAQMIKVILRNIFYNAIKYSNRGGTIMFDTEKHQDNVHIIVSDEGVGMDKVTLKKLFSGDIDSTKGTANETGSGFGLVICQDFVKMNNGSIEVTSSPNEGSTFTLIFPS